MICVVIGRSRHKMVQVEVQEAAKRGVQMIEMRLDFLAKAPDFKRLLVNKPCTMVATVRRPPDGGRWTGTEDARRVLLRQAIISGFDWVDIETDIAGEIRRFKDVKRIISYHNLREVPADLEKIFEGMCKQDADVLKVAVTAQSPSDNLRVLALLKNPPKPTVAFCMGDLGVPSRILCAKYGAPFTYAAFNKERGVAPGILSFDELKNVYHYDQINAETRVFGVIGDPINHSLSPVIHNAALRASGINGVYVPFQVPRSDLPAFLKGFDRIPVRGYSVTIPHKEAAVAVAVHKDPAVLEVKAANTLVRGKDSFSAYNTDYQAGLESLLAHLPKPADGGKPTLEKKVVLLVGAGGVGRAMAHALQKHGALLNITNRTHERSEKLAAELGCRHIRWEMRHNILCDLLVNCTSVGMHPHMDESPIHPSYLKPGLMVFDTIYTPETTLLVKEARARGCHVLTGVEMFVRQAATQFGLFTSREAPMELMYKVVKRALSPVAIRDEDDMAVTPRSAPATEEPHEGEQE
jgi:3-dehydroquinate dehydratase/shikimate dehydrogenase